MEAEGAAIHWKKTKALYKSESKALRSNVNNDNDKKLRLPYAGKELFFADHQVHSLILIYKTSLKFHKIIMSIQSHNNNGNMCLFTKLKYIF